MALWAARAESLSPVIKILAGAPPTPMTSIIGSIPTLTIPGTPTGLRVGQPDRSATTEQPNAATIPAQIKRAEDVRLYGERLGRVPGQGRVLGSA